MFRKQDEVKLLKWSGVEIKENTTWKILYIRIVIFFLHLVCFLLGKFLLEMHSHSSQLIHLISWHSINISLSSFLILSCSGQCCMQALLGLSAQDYATTTCFNQFINFMLLSAFNSGSLPFLKLSLLRF